MKESDNFKEYITAFEARLDHVIINDISPELYCKKYLAHLLKHKKYYLSIYADVLQKVVRHGVQDKANIVLVDFGAGNGLLGLFGKFCGFKKVFVNDIDEKFVHAARRLAEQLEIKMDGYIPGDINAVKAHFKNEAPDAVAGTDVIEHIYSLEEFFACIQQMNQLMITVFTTASNPANFLKVNSLKKLQLKDELEGGTPDDDVLFGETALQPFIKIREAIIGKYSSGLNCVIVKELAKATRGKNELDIAGAVKEFSVSGKMPLPPTGTNTCNPISGSWTERILSLEEYTRIYNAFGFSIQFYNGFYNVYDGGIKKYLKKMLNAAIAIAGNTIAPYIVIVGYPINRQIKLRNDSIPTPK
ncbi:MAG: class SAM-dependent methyltransferase [Ferruginibacter sp.]|uniref:class I SAM-dependent methyltransferase n=1 Tax=Ferruginibacter sp. TaxID=1940288 RepID=UPI002659C3B0|nr:class I SAM-dependent methyltransferase [Ferruginibacter sp.]MDB5277685.1 class SAM-dependent methyltransferase [Ferruginibacter sp.]